ncbi:hypothetical protein Tco_0323802 [Tanacetum coccineum]
MHVQTTVLQPHSRRVGFITTCSCSKTYYKDQDSRIMKAQVLKTKTSANSDIKDLPLRYQVYQGRLLTSFQDDAKYEHVGQDTRSQEFRDTPMQHMESVKKSIDERTHHKQEYDNWVNERQMQTTEEKVDTSKALDASLVDTESSGMESKEQDTSNRLGK